MAAYPSIGYTRKSERKVISNVSGDFTGGRVLRVRAIGEIQYEFMLAHRLITAADVSTLDTFYQTNRIIPFTFTWWDNATYDVVFTSAGLQTGQINGTLYWANARFLGTKQ